ncbi:MAG: DUF1272 domain-containing protein [Pseudomonadales bacterium]|nr:DUF1272 domain-containing protein [Pseudomonadales bacterium]
MLEMRPDCECCDKNPAPDATAARICSFDCTFCAACLLGTLQGRCPNCKRALEIHGPREHYA